MNPAVGRSFEPLNPPVKIEVVNAAPAVFKKSLRSAFLFSISLPKTNAAHVAPVRASFAAEAKHIVTNLNFIGKTIVFSRSVGTPAALCTGRGRRSGIGHISVSEERLQNGVQARSTA
jgi:hypothetical protein